MKKKKLKVGVIFGGRSQEREVSINTAKQVIFHLNKQKYKIIPIEIAKNGSWPKHAEPDQLKKKIDIAFVAMHGPFGEDGTIQGLLETLGIPFTFSGVLASSLAMDKIRTQQFLSYFKIKIPSTVLVTKESFALHKSKLIKEIKLLGKIVVVKPNRLGSSIGVSKIIATTEAITKAIKLAFLHDSEILMQKYIEGREITAPVLGNHHPQNLPVIEIFYADDKSDFYDYSAKYSEKGSVHIIPAKLPKQVTKAVKSMALQAHLALGCKGASRSDFIVTKSNDIFFLETNTIPGMTATSLLPQSAASVNIPFPKLLDKIIHFGLQA